MWPNKNFCQMRQGFSLMEILVALMIMSISLVAIMQLFAGGLRASRLSEEHLRAVFLAREKMEEIFLLPTLSEGVLGGEFEDGYNWTAAIHLREQDLSEGAEGLYNHFEIDLVIDWGPEKQKKHFSIRSTKVTPKES